MVRDCKSPGNVFVEALVVGQRKVRLQTGEHFGELRSDSEYDVMEYISPGEAPPVLAMAMA